MAKVSISLVTRVDVKEVLDFELKNRAYFESMIPGRGDAYYSLDFLNEIFPEIEEDAKNDRGYMYLIRNGVGELIGRVNLTGVERGCLQKAELGYRIGKEFTGKGYATEAVRLVLEDAFQKYRLHRVEAATSPENIGSQIVLIKNGFQFVGRAEKYIKVNGQWCDSISFARLNPNDIF